jgi:dipeptidyl aminopeptidase/acylaminoacyl peptidase
LLYHPAESTNVSERSLLIFLYGAGGSLENYNIARPPYNALRAQLAERGFYIMVPDLGKGHFMSDAAKTTLDGMVDHILEQERIRPNHVHIMGTSMGAGSSLAYAIHRPALIRSVCAVMPMTDFAQWVVENPRYLMPVAEAYGGTYEREPEAYDRNSAIRNVDAFAKIPVMLIHGNADEIVVYEQSKRLAELMKLKKYPCNFYTAEQMGHEDEVMRNFQAETVEFIEDANK